MQTVRVDKSKLLKVLKDNREKHHEKFLEALKGWKDDVVKALDVALALARKNKKYTTHFDLPQPVSHVDSYDEAIDQVSWSQDTVITLSQREFNQLVRDKWDWQQDFETTFVNYTKKFNV